MEAKNVQSTSGVIVATKVIADIFEVTPRRVRQMAEEGIIDKYKNGSFELISTVRKYILYLKTKNDTFDDNKSPDVLKIIEQTKHEKAKREMAEMKLSLMKGNLHSASDVQRVMTDMLTNFKSKIRAIPIKAAAQIKSNMTTSQVSEIISREIDETLTELSEYDPVKFYAEEYIEQDDEIDDDNDT